MARFNPHNDSSPALAAADLWLHNCAVRDGSLLSTEPLWSASLVQDLRRAFNENPIETHEQGFLEKLKLQLASESASAKQLMSEFLYMLILFQTNMKSETKRKLVTEVWSWSGKPLAPDPSLLTDATLHGIGSAGAGYLAHRWRELAYFIDLMVQFKALSTNRREELTKDGFTFAKWIDEIPTQGYRQFRNILLFLCFPDKFERISVSHHKRQILIGFHAKTPKEANELSELDLDTALLDLRTRLAEENQTPNIDFYDDKLKPRWGQVEDGKKDGERTWLLAWNPKKWDWSTFQQDRSRTARGDPFDTQWSCKSKDAKKDDMVFLARTGVPPRGVIARGRITRPPFLTPHFNADLAASGEQQQSVGVIFDDIRDPEVDAYLDSKTLDSIDDNQAWAPQSSGIKIKAADRLKSMWDQLPKVDLKLTATEAAPTSSPVSADKNDEGKPYGVDDIIADGCFLNQERLEDIRSDLLKVRNLILQGPPGTGKTWLAKRLAYALIGAKKLDSVRAVQFHPSLSYEDFVRGFRPIDGKLALEDGVLLKTIEFAKTIETPVVLVIEEINRGNPAQVFGEFLTLIEGTKRAKEYALQLAYPRYAGETVYVPSNLYIIGTMNVADRSLALVDFALRRRFAFVDLEPRLGSEWRRWCEDRGIDHETLNLIERRITLLNDKIEQAPMLGKQFRIGHSYVTPNEIVSDGRSWFRQQVQTQIGPLLDEYWYDKAENANEMRQLLLGGLE